MAEKKITNIGGQALIEGIMMRGPLKTTVAVRAESGEVVKKDLETSSLQNKYSFLKIPILRGFATFIDSLMLGQKALTMSIELSGALEEEPEEQSRFGAFIERHIGDKFAKILIGVATILGIGLSVLLFFFLPTWLFNITFARTEIFTKTMLWRTIFEGLLRIAILIGYMALCSQIKDIRRTFQYHGAEHKTICCFENGEDLTVKNVKNCSRFHPRCGTSFIITMLLIGMVIGFFIPFQVPWLRSAVKILCMPIMVGLGYECIRLCGRHDNIFTRALAAPGLWVQRITTKEPDDQMIEVAIAAMREVIPENGVDELH